MSTEVSETQTSSASNFVLPVFVRTREEVKGLIQEILGIEDFLNKAKVRQAGMKMSLPRTTPLLDKVAEANKMNILNNQQRMELAHFLRDVYRQGPQCMVQLSMSENSKLADGVLDWFRKEVDPKTLMYLSSNAKLGGGCIVRIKHRSYDFSLKKRFDDAYPVLQKALRAVPEPVATDSPRGKYF